MPSAMYCDFNLIFVMKNDPRVLRCVACGDYTHKFDGPFSSPEKPKRDYSISAEAIPMVSPKFYQFLKDLIDTEVNFIPLESGFFVMIPMVQVALDLSGYPHAKHSSYCATCGRYGSFTTGMGEGAIMAGQDHVSDFGLVRSTQLFSSSTQQCFNVIVGDRLAIEIMLLGFTGLHLNRIGYAN